MGSVAGGTVLEHCRHMHSRLEHCVPIAGQTGRRHFLANHAFGSRAGPVGGPVTSVLTVGVEPDVGSKVGTLVGT